MTTDYRRKPIAENPEIIEADLTEEENDDEDTEQQERYPYPKALLEAAGVETDEDFDAIPAIPLGQNIRTK